MPTKWELVLDLDDDEGSGERVCCYYFINCSNRSLFWLHKFDMTPLLCGLTEVNSKRRIRELEFPTPSIVPFSNLDHRTSVGDPLLVSFRRKIPSHEG
jgi:hypothetical protein